ncbi:deaminase domain-containing protein [Stenotrophomonas indicatrix]|uniref:deaminase domain-containing protein n=1 Tax=Stenotrophomonas indicatrix TaxID=2045451 RepID=UPI0032084F03
MFDNNKPYYLEHLVDCVNRLLYFRDVGAYLAHNRANSGAATLDKGNNRIIEGNIGCLIFTSGKHSYGVEWVAASFNLKDYLKEVLRSEGSYVLIEPQGKCIRSHIKSGDETSSFHPLFPAMGDDRMHDSEYLLLNFLGRAIEEKRVPTTGRLSLITERIPCESCSAVIRAFLGKFGGITLDVFYLHDTQDRYPEDFLKSVSQCDVRLIKVAFHTTVDFIEIRENPWLTIDPKAREQVKMFGGAPNQILQAVRPSTKVPPSYP